MLISKVDTLAQARMGLGSVTVPIIGPMSGQFELLMPIINMFSIHKIIMSSHSTL